MYCSFCEKELTNGVIRNGYTYCNEEHATIDWKESKADVYAQKESGGLYSNYEDYMFHEFDATIVDSDCEVQPFSTAEY